MAGTQEKAKLFDGTRKHLKQMMERQRKTINQEKKTDSYTCTYCPKAFFDAKFLVKHILRRHSEKLILMHKQVFDRSNSENAFISSSDLIKYIRTEFSDLKGEFETVKQVVSEFVLTNSDNQQKTSLEFIPPDEKSIHVKSSVSIADCSESTECAPNNSKDVSPDLEVKVHDLFEIYKNEVLLKEIKVALSLNKKEILEELKSSLLPELQNMWLHNLDKNTSEWKIHISQLQKDVTQLAEIVSLNTKKINSPEALQELEKKFEQQLQIFLNSNSEYDDKSKIRSRKSITHSGRKKKSLYTSNSQAFNSRETAVFQLDQNEIPQCDKNLTKKYRKANNFKPSIENKKSRKPHLNNEVNYIIDDKLRTLNIDSNIQKLSTEDYKKKMHILKSEKEFLSVSIPGFSETRNELNAYVERLAKSKLKAKCPKKLHFSDSHMLHSTLTEERHLEEFSDSHPSVPPVERGSLSHLSPVELAEDIYAQGDCYAATNIVLEAENVLATSDVDKCTSKSFEGEHGAGPKCIKSSDNTRDAEMCFDKPPENVSKDRVFPSFSGSSHNFEDLSDLSSLSDLED